MSATRLSKSSVDWAKLARIAGKHQQAQFNKFKSRSESYLRRVHENPEKPPEIDFAAFKKSVKNVAAIEQLEKAYKAVSVPYPADNVSKQIDVEEVQTRKEGQKFAESLTGRIIEAEELLTKFKSMIPYDQMTEEEFLRTFPDWAVTTEVPGFYPHHDKQPGLSKERRLDIQKKYITEE